MQKSNFFAIAFGLIAVCAITVAIILGMGLNTSKETSGDYKAMLSNHYQQAIHHLGESLENLDANINKLRVSNSGTTQSKLLLKIEGNADSAQADLSVLPTYRNDGMQNIVKYVNQVSDYAKTLSGKLSNGSKLSKEDKDNLKQLAVVSNKLNKAINQMLETADKADIFDVISTNDGAVTGSDEVFSSDEMTFDYPKLIYDGPFSDGQDKKVASKGSKISEEDGKEIISKAYADYNIKGVEFKCSINNNIEVYVYEVATEKGSFNIQLTTDGRIAQMDGFEADTNGKITKEQAIKASEALAKKLNLNVKAVWVSKSIDSCIYVNLCPVEGNIIIYPDLVKMVVNNDGVVVGVEAYSYLSTHKERKFIKISIDNADQYKTNLSDELKVINTNVALVPNGKEEVLCYEYECESGENKYFVYLDVTNGNEIEIFKIISGSEGYTVM